MVLVKMDNPGGKPIYAVVERYESTREDIHIWDLEGAPEEELKAAGLLKKKAKQEEGD